MLPFLSEKEQDLISITLKSFEEISLDSLPKCLVHGDLTKGNVILQDDGTPFLIDFSVTNWTTRIIELSIIIVNLMDSKNDEATLQEKIDTVLDLYTKTIDLDKREIDSLYKLCLAGFAMEFLGSRWRQEFLDDVSEETRYWLELGRQGLLENIQGLS